MKKVNVEHLEAVLVERVEYMEELKEASENIQDQITNLQYEIDRLLIRLYDSYKKENLS